jgi:alcohol dehydrogenase
VAIDYADANLVELPENMAFSTAASLGCRFITSFRAVIDQGRVKPGEWVAVHGCGGVGLSAIMIAHAAGAKVVAVDIRREKLALAQSLGAQVLLDASVIDDIPSAIRDQTGGGAHLSIEGLGHSNTIMNSILGTRKRGRHIQVGLAMGSHANPPVPMLEVVANEIEIIGSLGMQAHRYDAVLRLIDSGSLKLSTLIGEEIGIDAAIDALVDLDLSEQAGVTVITRF